MAQYLTQRDGIVARIPPTTAGTGDSTSDAINMAFLEAIEFILQTGTIVAGGTVDMRIEEGTDATTFNTSTPLTTITQLTDTDDDKEVKLEVRGIALSQGYSWLRAIVTRTTSNSNVSMVAIGSKADYGPASDYDLASVKETKVV